MKTLKIVFVLQFIGCFVNGQAPAKITEFDKMKQKTMDFALKNIDSADVYAIKMMKIAKVSQSDLMYADALSTMALIKQYESKLDEALQLNNESFELNKKLKNNKNIASNYYRFGNIYNSKGDFISATKYYLQCFEIAENEKMFSLEQKVYRKLSVINISQNKFNEALKYGIKATEIAQRTSTDENDEAENFLNLATCYKYLKQNDLAEANFKKAYQFFEKTNYPFKMADVLCEMAGVYVESDLIKSINISLKAQKIFDSINPESITSINNIGNLGGRLFTLAKSDSLIQKIDNKEIPSTKNKILLKAITYLEKAVKFSKKQGITQAILFYGGELSDIQAYKGDYENAYNNLQNKFKYNDSLFSQKNKNAIAKLESEKEVLQLNAENKQKSILNKVLVGSTVGLLLVGFLSYRNFRNRQKLQQSKITELEKDKQLSAVDAMLKGQEDERNRIAKDLHDGLGGMLSGVKISFLNMKENLIMSAENVIVFEQSISQLDSTISELRKIAHNLMPEALVRFGLNDAVKDFCTSIMTATHINIIYESMGEARGLDNTANTYIYRIIQELINNAVKHGKPSQILVQLTTTPNKILITVEDDGRGIDLDKKAISKGIGLTNIEHRVNYFKGNVAFEPKKPHGTVVNIELNV